MNDDVIEKKIVSVEMATYNGSKYLQERLDRFIAETRQPDELIISNDGVTTDDTITILNQFKIKAPFIVTILQNE